MRAIVADDHPMCREAATAAVRAVVPSADVVAVSSANEVIQFAPSADIVLLDLGLPDSRGIVSLIDVARAAPEVAILVVSGSEQAGVEAQIAAHAAAGFVSKAAPISELIEAVRTVLAGGRWFTKSYDNTKQSDHFTECLMRLTVAERRVLNAMRGGDLNKQIAHDLSLSEITVKQHVKAILRKLGVINRTQAVLALRSIEEGRSSIL